MKYLSQSVRMLVGVAALAASIAHPVAVGGVPPPAPASVRNFEDGDVVSFIGDSITWSRRWHRYIHAYHVTRFPGRRVTFVNAGISGDTAGGVLRRLERDVLMSSPSVAVFLLGMNDIGRNHYDVAQKDAPGTMEARERSLDGFRTSMTTLSERLRAHGVRRLIYCTPTPYDETVVARRPNTLVGANAALGRGGAMLREVADQFDGEVVDLHGPMNALNVQMQQEDPSSTIVGWDRVHPGTLGEMAITYLFLTAQGMPALVSRVAIDAAAVTVLESRNAEVSNLSATGDQLAFTALEGALPWPVEAGARKALSLLPFEEDLNQQILRIEGLQPGDYRLMIDDSAVGEFSAADLARGINLAFREETPQFQQAQQVQALLEERRESEMRLRRMASNEHFMFRDLGLDIDDFEAMKTRLQDLLAAPPDPDDPRDAHRRERSRIYLEDKPRSGEIRMELAQMLDQAYAAAQPRPHRYSLHRVQEMEK